MTAPPPSPPYIGAVYAVVGGVIVAIVNRAWANFTGLPKIRSDESTAMRERLDETAVDLIGQLRSRVDSLEKRIDQLEAQREVDQATIASLRTENAKLKADLASAEASGEECEGTVAALRTKIADLEAQIARYASTVA